MIFQKFLCLLLYYLGDLACKLNDFKLYQYLMLKSVDVNDKYKLGFWKEIEKPLNEN
jgi:hypothetical protein